MLSTAATGAWAELRRRWAIGPEHGQLTASLVEWGRLWRAKVEHASAILTELVSQGLVRVDPPDLLDINRPLTVHYLAYEVRALKTLKSSLKVYKSKSNQEKKEKIRIPEEFGFSEKRKEFAARYRVVNPDKEFELFCSKAQREGWTYADWDAAWRTWILQGVDKGWIKTNQFGSFLNP